jgi:hypothetical protein
MNIEPIVRLLDAIGAPHALIGAQALLARGHVRFTVDIDLITSDDRVLDEKVWAGLRNVGTQVICRRGTADDPLAGVVHILLTDGTDIDLIVARWKWEAEIIARAEPMRIGSSTVPVPRTSDLILLKLAAGGSLDLRDAATLLAIGDRDALIREVERHLAEVRPDVTEAWREVLAIEL